MLRGGNGRVIFPVIQKKSLQSTFSHSFQHPQNTITTRAKLITPHILMVINVSIFLDNCVQSFNVVFNKPLQFLQI